MTTKSETVTSMLTKRDQAGAANSVVSSRKSIIRPQFDETLARTLGKLGQMWRETSRCDARRNPRIKNSRPFHSGGPSCGSQRTRGLRSLDVFWCMCSWTGKLQGSETLICGGSANGILRLLIQRKYMPLYCAALTRCPTFRA